MYKIIQTIHGREVEIGDLLTIEHATTFAESRHIQTGAERTRVMGPNGRCATDRDGRAWEWVKK